MRNHLAMRGQTCAALLLMTGSMAAIELCGQSAPGRAIRLGTTGLCAPHIVASTELLNVPTHLQ
jgi:hypothetical protein